METSGLHVGFSSPGRVRHLVERGAIASLCGEDLTPPTTRPLTVLDLPWLGCVDCWDLAEGRIRVGLLA